MRTGALPLMAWGLALVLVVILGVTVWDLEALPADLLAGAGVAAVLTGAGSALGARAGRAAGDAEVLAQTSLSTVLEAFGATLALVGLAVGQAILWPGVGLMVVGVGGLAGEHRAARRLARGHARRPGPGAAGR
jgi:hypothetical protein